MSSSSSSIGRKRKGNALRSKRPRKMQKLLYSDGDSVFYGIGRYPNMERHLPADQSVTIQESIVSTAYLTSSTVAAVFQGLTFALNNFTSSAMGLAGVFDQYRIDLLEVWLVNHDPTGVNQGNPGILVSAIDHDDGNTPTSIAQLQSYSSSLTSSGACGHYHRFVPRIAIASFAGTFNGYTNEGPQWIDSASSGVQHFGFKVGVTPTNTASVYDLITRATVSFRHPF